MPRIFDVPEVFLAKRLRAGRSIVPMQLGLMLLAPMQIAWRGGQLATVLSIRNGVFRFRNSPPADRAIRR